MTSSPSDANADLITDPSDADAHLVAGHDFIPIPVTIPHFITDHDTILTTTTITVSSPPSIMTNDHDHDRQRLR
jgi:hypothetical protein